MQTTADRLLILLALGLLTHNISAKVDSYPQQSVFKDSIDYSLTASGKRIDVVA